LLKPSLLSVKLGASVAELQLRRGLDLNRFVSGLEQNFALSAFRIVKKSLGRFTGQLHLLPGFAISPEESEREGAGAHENDDDGDDDLGRHPPPPFLVE
jgi:hypothetical protein